MHKRCIWGNGGVQYIYQPWTPNDIESYQGLSPLGNTDLATANHRWAHYTMTTNEILSITTIIPPEWDGTNILFRCGFSLSATGSADTHTYDIGGRACANGDQVDVAIPYTATLSVTLGGVGPNRFYLGEQFFLPGNTPAPGDGLAFHMKRTDSQSDDPLVLGGWFRYGAI
jgi:hypothetical protein